MDKTNTEAAATAPGRAAGLTLVEALAVVEMVDAHLDSALSPEYEAQPLAHHWARVTKVCEEAGEVWQALSKATGENPRKGVCATEGDLLGELGDTASAAICAIQHVTKDTGRTWQVVSAALAKAHSRVPDAPPYRDRLPAERDSLTGRAAALATENGELRGEINRLGELLEKTAAAKCDAIDEREDLRQLVAGILSALDHGGPFYAEQWRERAGLSGSPDGGGGRDAQA